MSVLRTLLLSLVLLGSAAASDADDAKAAVEALRTAMSQKDASAALALTFDNGDAGIRAHYDAQLRPYAEGVANGTEHFTVLEARADGDVAIVLIDQDRKRGRPRTDIDPLVLVRRGSQWRIIFYIPPEDPRLGLDAAAQEAAARLNNWAAERKEPLADERRRLQAEPQASP